MASIPVIKAAIDADITLKVAALSISPLNVGGNMKVVTDELTTRGVKIVANTAALAALNSNDGTIAYVENVGFFKDVAAGPADGYYFFAGVGGRFWQFISITEDAGELISYNADAIYNLPAGYLLEKILVFYGSGGTMMISSIEAGADDELPNTEISAGWNRPIALNILAVAATDIFITGIPAGSKINFQKHKIKMA